MATTNNRIRIPSRKLLAAHAAMAAVLGAAAMIVHGGHVLAGEDDADGGLDNWRKMFARQADEGGFPLPILIENTAGGDHAMARRLDAIARLWDAIGEFGAGFVLDTCHAWAGGLDLDSVVDDIRAITGAHRLVHCNNSRDEAGSGRDRHAGRWTAARSRPSGCRRDQGRDGLSGDPRDARRSGRTRSRDRLVARPARLTPLGLTPRSCHNADNRHYVNQAGTGGGVDSPLSTADTGGRPRSWTSRSATRAPTAVQATSENDNGRSSRITAAATTAMTTRMGRA